MDKIKKNGKRILKRAVIREELVALTGDYKNSLILNQLIYWTSKRKDFNQFVEEEKERIVNISTDLDLINSSGWIFKKSKELSEEIMLNLSEVTIRRKIKELVNMGLIYERRNPKYGWDKTYQYRINLVLIFIGLLRYGYSIEECVNDPHLQNLGGTFKMKVGDFNLKVPNNIIDDGNFIMKDRTSKNVGAIPENTTENTISDTTNNQYLLTKFAKMDDQRSSRSVEHDHLETRRSCSIPLDKQNSTPILNQKNSSPILPNKNSDPPPKKKRRKKSKEYKEWLHARDLRYKRFSNIILYTFYNIYKEEFDQDYFIKVKDRGLATLLIKRKYDLKHLTNCIRWYFRCKDLWFTQKPDQYPLCFSHFIQFYAEVEYSYLECQKDDNLKYRVLMKVDKKVKHNVSSNPSVNLFFDEFEKALIYRFGSTCVKNYQVLQSDIPKVEKMFEIKDKNEIMNKLKAFILLKQPFNDSEEKYNGDYDVNFFIQLYDRLIYE